MKKIILTGLGNDGYRHHYNFKKVRGIKKPLEEILKGLGIIEEDLYNLFSEKHQEFRKGEYEDEVWHFKNKDYDIDIFFMKKKVKMIIRTTKRAKLIRVLEKYTDVIQPKIVKGMKNKKAYKAIRRAEKKKK